MTTTSVLDEADSKRAVLDRLRATLETDGYEVIEPSASTTLPGFFGSYRPDAIATKAGTKIAIEIRSRSPSVSAPDLKVLRDLFADHDAWQFRVYFTGADVGLASIPTATASQILARAAEVRTLAASGHRREALVMGWSLLEASLQLLSPGRKPRTPGTVVDTLTMNGFVSYDTERHLRPLIELRNRIVHGDVAVEPSANDVETVLGAVQQALTPRAA